MQGNVTYLYGSRSAQVTLKIVGQMRQIAKNRLGIFAAAILFSTGGAAIKACSLSSWAGGRFRSGIAAAVLYLLLPGARRRLDLAHLAHRPRLCGNADPLRAGE